MIQRHFILVLCLTILGGSIAAKYESDRTARKVPELPADEANENNVAGYIDIDGNPLPQSYQEGSAYSEMDDEDMYSGNDGDDEEGSADQEEMVKECMRLKKELQRVSKPGQYMPRCEDTNNFGPRQHCVPAKDGGKECYCVTYFGETIDGTTTKQGEKPIDCASHINQVGPTIRNPGETGTGVEKPPENTGKTDPAIDPDEPTDTNNDKPGDDMGPNSEPVSSTATIFGHPGILAGIVGGAVVGLLCAVLLVMFIVYRMRKKDEGSYALDEPKRSPSHSYTRAPTKEFYA